MRAERNAGLLADRVGPEGSVTGVEVDPDSVAVAQAFAATVRTAAVRVVKGRRAPYRSGDFVV